MSDLLTFPTTEAISEAAPSLPTQAPASPPLLFTIPTTHSPISEPPSSPLLSSPSLPPPQSRPKTLASKPRSSSKPKSASTQRPRASHHRSLKHFVDYLTNCNIIFEQDVYRQLEVLCVQQQANHTQVLALLRDVMLHVSSSSSSLPVRSCSLPPSSTSSPLSTRSTLPFTPTLIPFLDVSSPSTSVLPPTPPTSLVTPLPPPGLSLFTPIPFGLSSSLPISSPLPSSFPFSSPSSYAPPSQLRANLDHSSFIGILPGASSELFLAPHPLRALYPSTTPSTSVPPSSLDQAPLVTPLSTLPPLLLPGPSPSQLSHPSTLSFTLRQLSSPSSVPASLFSTFPTTTPSDSDPAP